MELVSVALNLSRVVFISSTMLGAGLAITLEQLTGVLRQTKLLLVSSPGAPFGAKIAMVQRGEVLTGSAVQILLAALGSVTFPVTANLLLQLSGLGSELSLPLAERAPSGSFAAVLVLGIGSSWEQIVSLLGSRTLVAGAAFTILAAVVGGLLTTGPWCRRTTLAGVAPLRNAGPAFAAIAIAFDNDPEILAALSGPLLVGLVLTLPAASHLATTRPDQ